MDRRFKITLRLLFREWHWKELNKRKYLGNLIWNSQGSARKDNRVVQNVGKPVIKFKFVIGAYLGGSPTKTPRHFSISTTGKQDRIVWMALPDGTVMIRQRRGKVWGEPFKLTEFFEDPLNPSDGELELLEFVYPGVQEKLPELLPGLYGVDTALKERFHG